MNQFFFIACFFVLCSSCQNENSGKANAPEEKSTKMDNVMESENVNLTKKYFDLFNQHDWKGMAAMYSASPEFKDPSLGPGIVPQTVDQIVEKYSGMGQMFPDLKDEVVAVYPSGKDVVVVEFVSSGTDKEGNKFELPICTIFTFQNGKIVKDYTYYDNFDESE